MIPLDHVADDAVAMVASFREAGGASFGQASVDISRASYRLSCAANGLAVDPMESEDFTVVSADGTEIGVRHYLPDRRRLASPAIVLIHGGGWVVGGLDTHDPIARHLAAATGLPLFAIDYRLAPEARCPAQLEDCLAVLRHLAANGVSLDVDPTAIVLLGDSAGGALAAALANDPSLVVDGVRIVAQVLLYPVADLGAESPSYGRAEDGFPLTAGSMRWFRSLYLAEGTDPTSPQISPLRLAELVPRPPAAFVVTLGLDPLCDEGIAYAAHLAQHGATVEHHHLPRHAHGIFTSAGKIATGRRMLERAEQFIRERTA